MQHYTGIANDDRRIDQELRAMGAFDGTDHAQHGQLGDLVAGLADLLTWMRWKGEVGVYGCRLGVARSRP